MRGRFYETTLCKHDGAVEIASRIAGRDAPNAARAVNCALNELREAKFGIKHIPHIATSQHRDVAAENLARFSPNTDKSTLLRQHHSHKNNTPRRIAE